MVTILPPHRWSRVMTAITWRFSHVTRFLQALMLPMVISSLPNLLTTWYSALNCPSNHSNINTNVIESQIKQFMRAHVLMLRNISVGYAIARENRVLMASIKRGSPSALYRLGLLYLFLNFPNIKHIASLYNRSIAYLASMAMNQGKSILHSLFMYCFPLLQDRCMIMVHYHFPKYIQVIYACWLIFNPAG